MRSHSKSYVFVGAFVCAMLVVSVVAIALVTGRTGATDHYIVTFDNVAGVKFGTQVRYEGFPVGQVERIEPVVANGQLTFRVDVSVTAGWIIPQDSRATIASSSLLAAKTLDIRAGTSSRSIIPGNEIASLPAADIFATVSAVAADIGALNREGVRPLIEQVSAIVGNLGSTLERDLGALLGSLRSAATTIDTRAPALADQVSALSQRLNESAAGLQRIMSPTNIDSIEQAIVSVELTTTNLASMSEDLSRTVGTIDDLVLAVDDMVGANRENVDKSLTDVQFALRSLTQNLGSILHNLDGTSRNMNEFSRLIRQNPGMLLNGAARDEIAPASASLE
ncbi:MAG: MlaD family protein [Alphaproteobacteria bacterium]